VSIDPPITRSLSWCALRPSLTFWFFEVFWSDDGSLLKVRDGLHAVANHAKELWFKITEAKVSHLRHDACAGCRTLADARTQAPLPKFVPLLGSGWSADVHISGSDVDEAAGAAETPETRRPTAPAELLRNFGSLCSALAFITASTAAYITALCYCVAHYIGADY
jgi:hypothetical protein